MNSWRSTGFIPAKKSVRVIGAFFMTSKFDLTCSGRFMPTTQPRTDWAGIERMTCRCRDGMLNTSGTAILERGTFAAMPCAKGCESTRLSSCSVHDETSSLFFVTPFASSSGCHYSIKASGMRTLHGA